MLSSEHGRMRRAQRLLEKRDLQAARKYGTCVESLNQRGELNLKYTFAGVVYITDPTGTREITSWAEPGAGLDVELVEISNDMQQEHARACAALEADMRTWTSHTVIVVDQSGSMRNTDVAGGASRSDAVWLTLALDVIAKQLSAKQAGSTDVISVVGMNASANVLIDCKPWDWLAFNAVVKLLRTAEPSFDGNYLPALDAAEALLMRNTRGSCALQLLFLSDGRPSDRVKDQRLTGMVLPERLTIKMQESIQKLAGRFGRRLTVRTVGIGSSASNYSKSIDDFVLLKQMAEHSQLFGCEGHFIHASLRPEALGLALSSLATSLTKTRTELTELGSASQRAVRDVRREARNLMDEPVLTDALWCYKGASLPPCRLSWDFKMRDWVPAPFESAAGVGVAVRKSYFGEGAERLVRKLREVDASGAFVGPLLVAKEGRFQSDMNQLAGSGAVAFHRTFCDTQTRAQNLAHVFNSWLERVPDSSLGELGMLVEKQLDPSKYRKWNDNKGGIDGQEPAHAAVEVDMRAPLIEEASDEEDESEEDEDGDHGGLVCAARCVIADTDDIPQAFSHFTYRFTKRRLLVCYLQGVLTQSASGQASFEFTDPVIH